MNKTKKVEIDQHGRPYILYTLNENYTSDFVEVVYGEVNKLCHLIENHLKEVREANDGLTTAEIFKYIIPNALKDSILDTMCKKQLLVCSNYHRRDGINTDVLSIYPIGFYYWKKDIREVGVTLMVHFVTRQKEYICSTYIYYKFNCVYKIYHWTLFNRNILVKEFV